MSKEFRLLLSMYAVACEEMGYLVAKENTNEEDNNLYKEARDQKFKLEKEILLHYADTKGQSKKTRKDK